MSNILHNNSDGWVSLAILENNIPKLDTRPLRWFNDFGNPLSKEEIIDLGYYGVKYQQYSFNSELEKVVENPIEDAIIDHANHEITITYSIIPLTKQELSDKVRIQRNILLQESDVLVYPDLWEDMDDHKKSVIKEYRKNLRDLTIQQGFPHEITWPSLEGIAEPKSSGQGVIFEE